MRNQPFSALASDQAESSGRPAPSRRRPLILALLILCFQIPIMLRLVQIQAFIGNRFIEPWRIPNEEVEPIPARDGRILSRDGVVLAQDQVRYDIAVDYRWLETPLDALWLRRQAARELTPAQRKDPRQREAAEERLWAHRDRLLRDLSAITGHPEQEIATRMAEIQRSVETMLAAVERRRQERAATRDDPFDWSEGLTGISRLVVDELTRPPDRFSSDPLILKEELQPHTVLTDVPLPIVAAIQSQPDRFRGVQIRSTSTRHYPQGDLAAHVVGVRRSTDRNTSGVTVRKGESGVERSQQDHLHGTPGELKQVRDRHGDLIQSEVLRPPQDGRDLVLTIDSRLQQLGERLLDQALSPPPKSLSSPVPIPRGACLVALDVWTGDLLALATSPRPSLNVLSRPTVEEWKRIQQDPSQPLFSRATQMALPPGGLFKLVTAMAALESGVVTGDEILHCQGYLNNPDQYRCLLFRQQGIGHGQLTLDEALSQSCHVCFYDMARRLGPAPLLDWGRRLGLGSATGIDLPGEARGQLPPLAEQDSPPRKVSGETLQLGVGQGALLVSPLQMARLVAAVANGGYLVTPRVTQSTPDDPASSPVQQALLKIPGLHSATLATIRRGLEQAVDDPRGAAHGARVDMLRMGAMCGTGTVAGNADHGWIAGYAPAENPRVVVVLVLEQGGAGENAAPLFRDFVTELLGYGELRPFRPERP